MGDLIVNPESPPASPLKYTPVTAGAVSSLGKALAAASSNSAISTATSSSGNRDTTSPRSTIVSGRPSARRA